VFAALMAARLTRFASVQRQSSRAQNCIGRALPCPVSPRVSFFAEVLSANGTDYVFVPVRLLDGLLLLRFVLFDRVSYHMPTMCISVGWCFALKALTSIKQTGTSINSLCQVQLSVG
jgi:hypothetical protein